MDNAVYRAPPSDGLLIAPLDEFTAVYHRASGITHLLTDPAPQILAAVQEGRGRSMRCSCISGATMI
ncbi:hypothetical protein [Sphingomonas sp. LR55]|uniref:hypothetical protein n=1 Tax=Sphingomonas sp. LR55 TaxID=3050231 RepID=UPI002FE1928E